MMMVQVVIHVAVLVSMCCVLCSYSIHTVKSIALMNIVTVIAESTMSLLRCIIHVAYMRPLFLKAE